jgi:hypothetical protein
MALLIDSFLMSADHHRVAELLRQTLQEKSAQSFAPRLEPRPDIPSLKLPGGARASQDAVLQRWQLLQASGIERENLLDEQTLAQAEQFERNIENFIGTVKVPVGVAGPLRVNGLHARGRIVSSRRATRFLCGRLRGVAAKRRRQPRAGFHFSKSPASGRVCGLGGSANRRVSPRRAKHHASRQTARYDRDRRRQSRLFAVRVFNRRRGGTKHGDNRDAGRL